jgi:protease PrsW
VTSAQVHLFTAISWGLLALDALLGVLILRRRWRRATTPERPGTLITPSLLSVERG